MNELDKILEAVAARPPSCGAKANIHAYLQWSIHQRQLWRHDEFKVKHKDIPPIVFTPIVISDRVVEHKTPPRKGERVICDQSVGTIVFVDPTNDECSIYWFDKKRTKSTFLSNLSSNSGSIRWRIYD